MIHVSCHCGDCRVEFTVSFKRPQPPWTLTCPVCQGKLIDQHDVFSDYYEERKRNTKHNESSD